MSFLSVCMAKISVTIAAGAVAVVRLTPPEREYFFKVRPPSYK